MQDPMPIATILVIVATGLISLRGFTNPAFVEKLIFSPEPILREKEYYRMVTSALLHGDWGHLFFNMFSLYSFGKGVELTHGPAAFLLIYLVSIIGGSFVSLWLHRNHVYRAYGASGGVCGILFASIFLFPGSGVMVFPFPFSIPAWLYAIAFIGISFYGIRRGRDNIGHDAHVGGAIIGLLTTALLYPYIVTQQPWLFLTVLGVSLAFFIYLERHPLYLPAKPWPEPSWWKRAEPPLTPEEKARQVNAVLEKISKSGMDSLTPSEHKMLLEASQKERREEDKE
jgi:membrane associated rhomboid family serine protease